MPPQIRRVDLHPTFVEEFQELRRFLTDAGLNSFDLDRAVFVASQAIRKKPDAGYFMGGDPPVYFWNNNERDVRARLYIYYSFQGDIAVLLSVQRGSRLIRPPHGGDAPIL